MNKGNKHKLLQNKLSKGSKDKEAHSRPNKRTPKLRGILPRVRAVTSPVDNCNPEHGFLQSALSEPNLSSLCENAAENNEPSSYNDSTEYYSIRNLWHVKSDDLPSNECLDVSSLHSADAMLPLSEEDISVLSQGSTSSLTASNCSIERLDGSYSADYVPVSELRRKSKQSIPSDINDMPVVSHTERKPLFKKGRPKKGPVRDRALSSPLDVFPPLPIGSGTEATDGPSPGSPRLKLARQMSKSHSDLSPSAPRKVTQRLMNLPKSLASALSIFKPHTSNHKLNIGRKLARAKKRPSQSDQTSSGKDRPTLEEYCRIRSLTITSNDLDNTEFSISMTGTASSHFLRPSVSEETEPGGAHMETNETFEVASNGSGIDIRMDASDSDSEDEKELASQELESHFNEHFGWEERRLRTTSIWSVSGVLVPPKDPTELQFNCEMGKTMTTALATVFNLREVPNDDTNKKVADYVMKVFHSDEETLRKGWRKASMQERPEEKLQIYVRRGSGLTAKDANGKSDPYVRVGIIDASEQGQSIVKKENLLDWQKEGGIMPTGEIQQSKVKEATLEPQWNEQLELSMGKSEKEMLVVEVWDSDKHMAAPSKVKGLKHFFKDIRKTDDFMGRAFLSLWNLSGKVEGKVLELCSHSGKHKHGTITVDLTIERVKKNVSQKVGMWEHLQLTHAVVNYEARLGGQYCRKWNAQLSDEATMLLDRHAQFSGLSEAHRAAIRLSVLVKYHRMFAIKMSTFSALIEQITRLEGEINALQKTSSTGVLDSEEIKWVHVLLSDLTELARDIEEVLKNHLTVYNIKDPKHVERIRHRINILIKLYSFHPFVEQLPPEKRKLHDVLVICIQKAVPTWFIVLKGRLMPDRSSPDMLLSAFKALIQHTLNVCHRSLNKLNPIFAQAGVDYFSHFYVIMDTLIFGEAASELEFRASPDDVTTYEVYKALKEIRKLKTSVVRKHWANLKINSSHELFTTKVNHWVTMATQKCKGHIKKAIELDKVVQVTDEVQFSSSAVDSTGFLFQLMKLSDELEWPSKAEAFTIKVSVVRNVCDLAIFYVNELFSSLKPEDMFDKHGRFRATEKLSIVLNNMQHIKQVIVTGKFISECPLVQEHMKEEQEECLISGDREAAQKKLEEEQRIRDHSMELMTTLMESAGEDIDTKIADIICQIIQQMSPEMNRLIEEVLNSKAPTVGLETMDPLMTYMASNLQTLGNHLLTPVFQLILRDVWCVSNDCLLTFLDFGASKKASGQDPSQYYNNLKFVLQSFKDFFYADGNGLSQDDLETQKYKELCYRLDILSLHTDRLILRFYSELADIQTAGDHSGTNLGKLLLSIGYHQEREVIEVNLFQGKDLPGLDNSGLSDPFVELTLMPPWHFGQSQPKKQKTAVKKKTVNPVYNEDFIIHASKQAIQVEGAVLLLTVYDYDLISANDLCGICVIPCKDIPHLSPVRSAFDNPNAVERRNLTLPLFKVPETNIALMELSSRANASDPKATEFLKSNKHILSDNEPDVVLPHQRLRSFLKKQ